MRLSELEIYQSLDTYEEVHEHEGLAWPLLQDCLHGT